MDQFFSRIDIGGVSAALAVAMLVAWQIGKLEGVTRRHRGYVQSSKFADASMALLGLLIAFSFGMSIERHDQRRVAAVADANAIGDFYTCAALLNEPVRGKLRNVVRSYAELRLAVGNGKVDVDTALMRSDQMHEQMTQFVAQALNNGTPIAVSLTNTLNALISSQAVRLSAYRNRLPAAIIWLLFAGAIVAVLLMGREQGINDAHDILGTLLFIFLTCVAVYVTLDLNRPEGGLIRVSQEPIAQLIAMSQ